MGHRLFQAVEMYKESANVIRANKDTIKRVEEAWHQLQEAENCHSLLKKHLTKDVMDKLKIRETKIGATLLHVIQSGATK